MEEREKLYDPDLPYFSPMLIDSFYRFFLSHPKSGSILRTSLKSRKVSTTNIVQKIQKRIQKKQKYKNTKKYKKTKKTFFVLEPQGRRTSKVTRVKCQHYFVQHFLLSISDIKNWKFDLM